MLQALIAGEALPAEIAQLARLRLRHKLAELEAALEGCVEEHHRFLMARQLGRIETAEADLDKLDARLREKLLHYDTNLPC
jgi:transposase